MNTQELLIQTPSHGDEYKKILADATKEDLIEASPTKFLAA